LLLFFKKEVLSYGEPMTEVEDRLTPKDGLNSYNVVLARMDLQTRGSVNFTFAVTSALLPVAELHVEVPATGQSLDRMTVEEYDALIDIFRQLMFRAEGSRRHHDRHAHPPAPIDASVSPDVEGETLRLDAGFGQGLRINVVITGVEPPEGQD